MSTNRSVLARCAIMLLLLLPFFGIPPRAQEGGPAPEARDEPAAVAVGSRLIAVMRVSIYGHSPRERAAMAQERIRAALRQKGKADLSTVDRTEGTLIYYGSQHLLTIAQGDVDSTAGRAMKDDVGAALAALEAAFEQHRRGRDPAVLAGGAAVSALATLLYVMLVAGVLRGSARAGRFVRARLERRRGLLVLLLEASVIARLLVSSTLVLALTIAWLSAALRSFPQTETAGEDVLGKVLASLSGLITGAVASAPNLLIALFILALALTGVRCLNAVLKAVLAGKLRLPGIGAEVARPTATLAKVLVILTGLIAAYPYLPGTSSDAFKGVSVMAGVIVSFGSAALFGQISAGFVLMYSGAFRRGDWIVVGDGTEGRLREIGYLTTRVQTFREEVYIPNLVLLGNSVRNLSRAPVPEATPLMARVSIGYDAPWRQVYRLLSDAAARTQSVLRQPSPVVHQVDLADFYVVYELTVYIDRASTRRFVRSSLFENIQDAFNEAGVQIMSPHFEGNPDRKVLAARDAEPEPQRSAASSGTE